MIHDIPNVSLADVELTRERALFSAFAGVSSSDFIHLRFRQPGVAVQRTAQWRILVLGLPYVAAFVAHIARVRIESQVRGVHTKFIRTSRALMANLKSIWYQTFAQQPRGTVGRERPKSLLTTAYLSISPCREARFPQPAFVGSAHVHLAPKAVGESARKSLRGEILRGNVFTSHIKLPQPESPYGGTRVLPFIA